MSTVTLLWIIMRVKHICENISELHFLLVAFGDAGRAMLKGQHSPFRVLSYFPFPCILFSVELEKWRSPEFYEQEVHRMQLPFSGKVPGSCVSVEERQERRAQQLRRLQEINARRREEKLLQDQEKLDRLMAVQARDSIIYS